MNKEICNSLSGYFHTLYVINQNLVKLCGISIYYNYELSHVLLLDIIKDLPRIIPYECDKKHKTLCLYDHDGLLEYKKQITFLERDYNNILKNNYDFLDKVRRIRNNYEHKMHGIRRKSSSKSSLGYFEFELLVDNHENKTGDSIIVKSSELIKVIMELNTMFDKLIKDVKVFANKNNLTDYSYYSKICEIDYLSFNEIYKSDLLEKLVKL